MGHVRGLLQIALVDLLLPGAPQAPQLAEHPELHARQPFFLQPFIELLHKSPVQQRKAQPHGHFPFHALSPFLRQRRPLYNT